MNTNEPTLNLKNPFLVKSIQDTVDISDEEATAYIDMLLDSDDTLALSQYCERAKPKKSYFDVIKTT